MEKIKLKTASLPKLLADLTHSNQFLKVFSLCCVVLCGLLAVLAMTLGNKDPIVLSFQPSGRLLEEASTPKPEDEIREAIKAYISKRYKWSPSNVQQRLKEAEAFVSSASLTAYRRAIDNLIRFSTEKSASQRIYPEKIDVNLAKKIVSVSGDRITEIQGIKVAGNLQLELNFESGPRSSANPWGIFVVKERE